MKMVRGGGRRGSGDYNMCVPLNALFETSRRRSLARLNIKFKGRECSSAAAAAASAPRYCLLATGRRVVYVGGRSFFLSVTTFCAAPPCGRRVLLSTVRARVCVWLWRRLFSSCFAKPSAFFFARPVPQRPGTIDPIFNGFSGVSAITGYCLKLAW